MDSLDNSAGVETSILNQEIKLISYRLAAGQ